MTSVSSMTSAAYRSRPSTAPPTSTCALSRSGSSSSATKRAKANAARSPPDGSRAKNRPSVPHWCDNGDAHLDLEPTADHDAVIAKLTQTLQQIDYQYTSADDRQGELTLQKLLRLILDQTHRSDPQPLPVLLFLHSDT